MDLTIKVTRRWKFYSLLSLLMLSVFLRYVFMFDIPSIIFVAILSLMAFLGNRDEILTVCICCIPLYEISQYYFVIAACILIYLIKYGKDIKLDFSFIPIVLIIIWEVLHCFFYNTNLKSIIAMICIYVFFIVLLSINKINSLDYGFVVRVFSVLVLWVCVVLVFRLMIVSNFNLDVAFFNMQRLGLSEQEISGLVINPNSLGVQCVLAVSSLMQLRMNGNKKASDVVLIISILVLGSLTASRTYLACLIIMVVYLFLASKDTAKKKLKLFLGTVIVGLIGVLLLYLIFPSTLELFISRLQVEDISGGRGALFTQYNEYLISSVKSLFWGIGSIDMSHKISFTYLIADNVPHNGIQEVLVAWGIPGLILFAAFIFALIRRSKQVNPRQTLMNYMPFVILFAKIQVGQMITSVYTMLAFALIYISLCVDFNRENQVTK